MVAKVTMAEQYRQFVTRDAARQVLNWANGVNQGLNWANWVNQGKDTMKDEEREYRYEERNGDFTLKCWHDGRESTIRGHYHTRPEWLEPILAVAKINGSAKKVKEPPPDFICWFRTTASGALTEFIELE